jgi:hypothetical protein
MQVASAFKRLDRMNGTFVVLEKHTLPVRVFGIHTALMTNNGGREDKGLAVPIYSKGSLEELLRSDPQMSCGLRNFSW